MRTNMKVKYGLKFKKADEYDKIQEAMPEIIKSANIPWEQLIKKVGISKATHYRKMKEKRYSSDDIIAYIKAILQLKI
jgi:predicted DNA-binding transcriptional regulator AlpA